MILVALFPGRTYLLIIVLLQQLISNLIIPLSVNIVSKGDRGFEARKTSKEQTKMPRFMLESP